MIVVVAVTKHCTSPAGMKLFIEDVPVLFPYEYIYPEQLEYMTELKKGLDQGGHMVLEMPSGTGKTTTLLSLLIAYLHHHADEKRKVVYCTRTVGEVDKTASELRKILGLWETEEVGSRPLRGVCLTAKKNLCIEPSVVSRRHLDDVDAGCRSLTAPWQTDQRCVYFDTLENQGFDLRPGAYSLSDLKRLGEENHVCPYYLARKALKVADIVIHSFLYIVDPIVAEVTKEYMDENTIVVMDEAHNVDDVCIEAMSLIVTKDDAFQAKDNVKKLNEAVDRMKATNRQKLQEEYDRLVNGLAMAELARSGESTAGVSVQALNIPQDIAEEAIPGSLRQANHFLAFMQRLVDFTHRVVCRISRTYVADPLTFLTKVKEECSVDVRHLRYLTERLKVLLNTLQITSAHSFHNVSLIAQMFMTLSTHYTDDRYEKPGFVVVCEASDPTRPTIPDPVIRLVCVDASLALREVFAKYRSVILTSGTLSPLDIYPKMLGFSPVIAKSFQMTLSRKCIAPVVVTRSSESVNITAEEVTSSFVVRKNPEAQATVSAAYEDLLRGLAKTVPDGIVCFFTGYQYMSEVLLGWHRSGFLKELSRHKLIFVETQSVDDTATALESYRRACDIGRGAIFMSIARGKIAEGIDFDSHYGRAVVMFGVPFLPPIDEPLRQRIHWMEICLGIPGSEYRNFDAMRQASQCIGRVLRNKTDYGMMLLVDRRFALNDKRKKLPIWIQQCLKENTNLSVDAAVAVARGFFKEMAQPWEYKRDLGTTLFSVETLARKGFLKPSKSSVSRKTVDESRATTTVPPPAEEIIRPVREPDYRKRSRE
ncbi:TFIIH basal transcription factor complex helicase subunit, putative [Trypanosoma brucei brucei TREU927]|uniref:DNA 5'-3' helicase n=2 Tax=Trypanozoon TaxID=39700 RepID=Q57YJ9_TRYB2|nr:TFIIH basal transcription factor complex helicase subunit, putative [Trypanosoma brucei brucei TREU927]AAX69298.1 TFIIH basal transcription factor complex helicase subunit, putative [Trypanosoma brucei]AAZ13362.1 TFIIH basal transcription factor complex helicase subunit, putative [Trypanosoma brucei brucei TREU927]